MIKILLVTLHSKNLGNRLQNLALKKALEKKGSCVITPVYGKKSSAAYAVYTLIKTVIKYILYLMGVKKYYLKEQAYKKREKKFREFDKAFIGGRTDIFDFDTSRLTNDFDLAITGSDQVWHNWTGSEKELKYFYLSFTDREKRASYAPSFGFSEFPERDKPVHKKGLSEMKYLSCREREGSRLIKELTGRDAPVLPDPTMLLSREEWKEISRRPDYDIPEKFMLVYFLGDTDDCEKTLSRISKERGCETVNIYRLTDMTRFCTDPCEFLWLAENADCICTDSFHACVFSIIFERPFLAFPRKGKNGMDKMFDRIENLLFSYGLEDHIWQGENSPMLPVTEADNIPEKLKANARKGLDYIDMLLSDI